MCYQDSLGLGSYAYTFLCKLFTYRCLFITPHSSITFAHSDHFSFFFLVTHTLHLTDGLLKMLYMILLHQVMRHPGAPRSAPHALPPAPLPVSFQDADIGNVTLALQTLGSFNFGGN